MIGQQNRLLDAMAEQLAAGAGVVPPKEVETHVSRRWLNPIG